MLLYVHKCKDTGYLIGRTNLVPKNLKDNLFLVYGIEQLPHLPNLFSCRLTGKKSGNFDG